MSSTKLSPATPANLRPVTVAADAPPGTWRHPRFDEIHRRLNATTFGERNIRTVVVAGFALVLSLFVDLTSLLELLRPILGGLSSRLLSPASYLTKLLQAIAFIIITYAMLPLLRPQDDLSDIPLTPTQRALLGLPPSSHPATPGSQYVTPPKYSRSSSRSLSGSPYSSGRNSNQSIGGGPSYSPSASPLFQKAVGRDVSRRLSYGTPSPLSLSRTANDSSGSVLPSTPSPSNGRGASVSLTSRWLYEKGRSSSGMRNSLYS